MKIEKQDVGFVMNAMYILFGVIFLFGFGCGMLVAWWIL